MHSIIVKTSQSCNLACPHCSFFAVRPNQHLGSRDVATKSAVERARAVFRGVAASRAASCERSCEAVEFYWHGAEPLLLQHGVFDNIANEAREVLGEEQRVLHHMTTNGTLLDSSWASELKRANVAVSVSLDGPPEVHDNHRPRIGGRGSYKDVVKGIELLRAAKVPFGVLTVVHGDASGAEVIQHHLEFGIRGMDLLLPFNNWTTTTVSPTSSWKDGVRHYVIDAFREWFPMRRRLKLRWFDSVVAQSMGGRPTICTQEQACPETTTVGPRGELQLCDRLDVCEDFTHSGINIADANALERLRRWDHAIAMHNPSVLSPEVCTRCRHYDVCAGGCPVYRYDRSFGAGPAAFSSRVSVYCDVFMELYDLVKSTVRSENVEIG